MTANGVVNGSDNFLFAGGTPNDLDYADKLNADPERLKFAYVNVLHVDFRC